MGTHPLWTDEADAALWNSRDEYPWVLAERFGRSSAGIRLRLRLLYKRHDMEPPARFIRSDIRPKACSWCSSPFLDRDRPGCATCSEDCADQARRRSSGVCYSCGVPKSPDLFRVDRRHSDGLQSQCRDCQKKYPPRRSPEARRRELASFLAQNAESASSAANHGKVWTGPELEMAVREDLAHKELARMLGRSIAAVSTARNRARREPKYQTLAS